MTTRTAERLDDWESRPFSDGYEGIRTLADRSFSGAVAAGRTTLYMLNGSVVGILDGSIEDFEDATGTIYEAPTPALPLLAVMQDRSEEVRAKYYSEETSLSEADEKLAEGSFTGYVELSENVLSGDYYVVYHAGKSMSVAYVGESERLLTDEEAFEQADDEVGIYEVRPVEIEPIEIPEPEPEPASEPESEPDSEPELDPEPTAGVEDTETASDDGSDTAESADQSTGQTEPADDARSTAEPSAPPEEGHESADQSPVESRSRRAESSEHASTADDPSTQKGSSQQTAREQASTREPQRVTDTSEPAGRSNEPRTDRSRASGHQSEPVEESRQPTHSDDRAESPGHQRRGPQEPSQRKAQDSRARRGSGEQSRRHESSGQSHGHDSGDDVTGTVADRSDADAGSDEPGELEHRTIPSIDPDRTWTAGDDTRTNPSSESNRSSSSDPVTESVPTETTGQSGQPRSDVSAELADARAEIRELEERVDELRNERADLESARDDLEREEERLQSELDRVREERDDLETEVERLRDRVTELERRLEETDEADATAETTLSALEAIDGTNLFVRYGSKGDATLESAHDDSADADEVNENLNLENHTQFDTAETVVDGQPYEAFLEETLHYRFVDWVVRKLLYEIRDTDHQGALADLYDALPRINRAELNGSISVTYTEDGEEQRTQERFDVVLRDRMGNPLIVTNLNETRTAATDEMMTTLVTAARRVGESNDRLAGAFFVTSSFFDPDALETAAEATGGGILSRDKRESFVRLSRKDGFHLCLVESRNDDFHLEVPEL
ncbi:MAG: hypothetical protein ABEI57_04500 [Halapricum sp.]